MKVILVIIGIAYLVCFFPALRTAIAFWLHRDDEAIAYMSMRYGFLFGFFSIWIIYPYYIIKDCFSKDEI